MSHGSITVAPSEARDRLLLSMVIDGGEPISVALEPPTVDALIEKIGLARAAMRDRIMSDEAPLTVLEFTVVNPRWRANPNIALYGSHADSVVIGLQHSSYGWLSFVLPDKEARALGQWLVDTTSSEEAD